MHIDAKNRTKDAFMIKPDVLKIKEFNQDIDKNPFYANEFSVHLRTHHANIIKPHKHDFYLVVLFTKGEGYHEIDFQRFSIEPGSVFFMKPEQTHHWEFTEEPEGVVFFHSREFYQLNTSNILIDNYPIYASIYNNPHLLLSSYKTKSIEFLFNEVLSEYKQRKPFQERKISSLIDQIYIETSREFIEQNIKDLQESSSISSWFNQLTDLIEVHYKTEHSPQFYAEQLNITVKHLNKTIRNSVDKTTTQLIQDRIMLEAKRLLIQDQLSIKEISYELGIFDSSYFTRLFKKKCLLTPKQFSSKYSKSTY